MHGYASTPFKNNFENKTNDYHNHNFAKRSTAKTAKCKTRPGRQTTGMSSMKFTKRNDLIKTDESDDENALERDEQFFMSNIFE